MERKRECVRASYLIELHDFKGEIEREEEGGELMGLLSEWTVYGI